MVEDIHEPLSKDQGKHARSCLTTRSSLFSPVSRMMYSWISMERRGRDLAKGRKRMDEVGTWTVYLLDSMRRNMLSRCKS